MFESIKNKINKELFVQGPETEESQPSPVSKPNAGRTVVNQPTPKTVTVTLEDNDELDVISTPTTSASNDADKDMVEKIHALLQKLNKEGIDFFEVWDSSEQMDGGATPVNIKNAFTVLKAASGGKLTKDYVLETAQYYKEQIQSVLDGDIKQKKAKKQELVSQLSSEKSNLQQEVNDISKQIKDLTTKLNTAENSLNEIDDKYKPTIQKIDQKITSGQKAVQTVIGEIQTFVETFTKVVK